MPCHIHKVVKEERKKKKKETNEKKQKGKFNLKKEETMINQL
jgi:hypothetical protein